MDMQEGLVGGIRVRQLYVNSIETKRNKSLSWTKGFQIQKMRNRSQSTILTEEEAYAALQSYALSNFPKIDYHTEHLDYKLYVSRIRVFTDKSKYPLYHGEVTWEAPPLHYVLQPPMWSHRMSGGTIKQVYPVVPQRYYTPPGQEPIPHLGVNWNEDRGVYEGVECHSPEWHMSCTQQLFSSVVTMEHIKCLQLFTKKINFNPFRSLPKHSVLYLGADLDESIGSDEQFAEPFKVTTLVHHFIFSPHLANFYYGDVFVPLKEGHEYMWASTERFIDINTNTETTRISQVNIASMYHSIDFDFLGLDDQGQLS
jgi:hypothetical protein